MGEEGQERLLRSRVLIVGAGGLGSPCAMYLTAAGVGTIAIADGDEVSLSNLQRQVIHHTGDVGKLKVVSAGEKMRSINPETKVIEISHFITDEEVDALVKDFDFVIEATDNFASRYRINDACVRQGKPFCIGGVSHYSGQLMTVVPGSMSYRDLFPEEDSPEFPEKLENPPSPQVPLPVLGPSVGILGTIMATECIKVLTGVGEPLTNQLLTFDALTMNFTKLTL